jgi:hypothetical protein
MIEKSEIISEVNTTTETTNNENIIYNTCTCRIRNKFIYPRIESRVSDRWETEIVTLYITQLSSFTTSVTERLLK